MLSDLIVTVLKPNKACLISCYFIIINEITTRGQFNRNTAPQHFRSFAQSDKMTLAMKTIVGTIWALNCCPRPVGNWPCLFHTPSLCVSLSLSLFICSPWSTSLCFPLCLSLYQITSHRWLIRSASSSGNTDRSWRRWDESGSGRRRRPTRRRNAGSDSTFFFCLFCFFIFVRGEVWRPISTRIHIRGTPSAKCGARPGVTWLNRDATGWSRAPW